MPTGARTTRKRRRTIQSSPMSRWRRTSEPPTRRGDSPCWVASANGRIVASLSTYLPKPDSPHFAERARFLYAYASVLRPWRRRGLGKRLLTQVHELMCAHDKTLLTLSTHEAGGHGFLRHIAPAAKLH